MILAFYAEMCIIMLSKRKGVHKYETPQNSRGPAPRAGDARRLRQHRPGGNRRTHPGADRSAARGKMAVRELIIFRHDSELGCAPAHKLFELVTAARKPDVTVPRCYGDYVITVDEAALPEGVTLRRMG